MIPIALTLLHHRYMTTLVLFAVAAASDAADGFLARQFGWQTTVGGILDPAADKLMLASVFVTLAILKLAPVWLSALVVARDVVIVLGAAAYRAFLGPVEARPSVVSKLNTLCQIVFILSVLGREQLALPPPWVAVFLGALTFATVVISGIDYVWRYGRLALGEVRSRRAVLSTGGS